MNQTTVKHNTNAQKKNIPGGVWIEKPRRSEILVCESCQGKYIKTRPRQTSCVRCMATRGR